MMNGTWGAYGHLSDGATTPYDEGKAAIAEAYRRDAESAADLAVLDKVADGFVRGVGRATQAVSNQNVTLATTIMQRLATKYARLERLTTEYGEKYGTMAPISVNVGVALELLAKTDAQYQALLTAPPLVIDMPPQAEGMRYDSTPSIVDPAAVPLALRASPSLSARLSAIPPLGWAALIAGAYFIAKKK